MIGFDLGDGESSVSQCVYSGAAQPQSLEFVGGEASFPTAIGSSDSGEVLIGQSALQFGRKNPLYISFKARPALLEPEASKALASFFWEVLNRARGAGCELEGARIVVGHPSGWSEKDVQSYQGLLRGDGQAVHAVAESRAALVSFKDGGAFTGQDLEGTILIVDIGSSTTDLTLVQELKQAPVDFGGNALGGRVIERAIMRHYVDHSPEKEIVSKILSDNPGVHASCMFVCRKLKEAFFRDEGMLRETGQTLKAAGYEDLDETRVFIPSVSAEIMDSILAQAEEGLDGQSWVEAFAALLTAAKLKCEAAGHTPRTIAMTGGASRMSFTQSACSRAFPEARIVVDPAPETTISRGLALAGRWDARRDAFASELDPLCEGLEELFLEEASEFIDAAVPQLAADFATNVVRQGLLNWRSGSVRTLDRLEGHLSQLGDEWSEGDSTQEIIKEAMRVWTESVMLRFMPRIRELCAQYELSPEMLVVGLGANQAIAGNDGGATKDAGNVDVVSTIVAILVSAIAVKVAMVVTPIVIGILVKAAILSVVVAGPIGLVVAAVVGVAAFFGGKGQAETWVKTRDWPSPMRKLMMTDSKVAKACAEAEAATRAALAPELAKSVVPEAAEKAAEEVKVQLGARMEAATIYLS